MHVRALKHPWAFVAGYIAVATLLPVIAAAGDFYSYLPPEDAPYVAEEARIRTPSGLSLAGTLTLPTRGVLREGRPLRYPVLLLVGSTCRLTRDGSAASDAADAHSQFRPLYELADSLTRRDVAVLRLDNRGIGASMGASDSTTFSNRCEDVHAAIAYLRRRTEIDPHRIALLGIGEGAAVVSVVAGTEPELRAAVLLAAPTSVSRPPLESVLMWPGDAAAVAAPAVAEALVAAQLGRVAKWVSIVLGGAEVGPRLPVLAAHRRHRR